MSEHPPNQRTTLADVATRAGVSRATASRALAGDPRISDATRSTVREAAEALEYVPNLAARSLRARETRALGLVLADLRDPVHAQVAAGFELGAAQAGYTVIIVAAGGDLAEERRALKAFVERSTDGICVASGVIDPDDARDRVGSAPLMLIQPDHDSLVRVPGQGGDGVIRADDANGVRAAVWHLWERGRRDIAYLGSGERATNHLRRLAAASALKAAGGPSLRSFQVPDDAWTRPHELARAVSGDLPDGVICYDDKTALALLDGLRGEGVAVPQDVAVVGFDGIPFAALSNPRLTTVATPVLEMGELGARSLVAAIGSRQPPPACLLPVELVIRESSGGAGGLREDGVSQGTGAGRAPRPEVLVGG